MNLYTTRTTAMRAVLLVTASFLLVLRTAGAGSDVERPGGITWSTDLGYRVAWAGDIRIPIDKGLIAGMSLGVQGANVEAELIGRLSEESATAGIESLVRMPFFRRMFVGGGVHFGLYDMDRAFELVLPRVDLRFQISRSWDLSWTVLRLSYVDKTLGSAEEQYLDEKRALIAATSLGVRARMNRLWEREAPAPLASGALIRANHMLGLVGVVADERLDPDVQGDWEAPREDFPHNVYFALELTGGYRFSFDAFHLELGVPVGIYNKLTVGLSALWRLKTLPFAAVGLQVSYFPSDYILVEIPRVMLTYRPSDAVEIFLNPIGVVLLIEPARDVWVEEGFESKVPYWGLVFGAGIGWTIPTSGRGTDLKP